MSTNSARKFDFQNNSRLGVSEASLYLKVTPSTLRRLENEGKITSERLSNGYRQYSFGDVVSLKEALGERKSPRVPRVDKNFSAAALTHGDKSPRNLRNRQKNGTHSEKGAGVYRSDMSVPQIKLLKRFSYAGLAICLTLVLGVGFKVFGGGSLTSPIKLGIALVSGTAEKGAVPASVAVVARNDELASVLGDQTGQRNYQLNVNIPSVFNDIATFAKPAGFKEGLTTTTATAESLLFIGGAQITGLKTIDTVTETSLEQALDITGDVVSGGQGGLNDVKVTKINGAALGEVEPESGYVLMGNGDEWVGASTEEIASLGVIETGTWEADPIGPGFLTGVWLTEGITYTFPATQAAAANRALVNDGAGNLSWAALDAGALLDDSVDWVKLSDTMTLDDTTTIDMDTNSADFNFDGGTLYISHTGNIGIGTTSPLALLSVGASSQFQVNSSGVVVAATGISSSGTIIFSGTNTSTSGALYSSLGTLYSELALDETRGGTGQTSITTGDVLYGSASNTLSKLAVGVNGYVLLSNGTIPTWGQLSATAITADSLDYSEFKDALTLDSDTPTNFYNAGAATSYDMRFYDSNQSKEILYLDNVGRVGIGNTAPSVAFSVGASEAFKVTDTGAVTAVTYNGNTITASSGTLTLAAGKTVSFANDFSTAGSFPVTLSVVDTTNVTLPTTGTLLTSLASANQTITSTQLNGSVFSLANTQTINSDLAGATINLSGDGTNTRTGLQISVTGASSTNYDIRGTSDAWKVYSSGQAYFAGPLAVGTTAPATFTIQSAGHVGPDADSLYNLGSNDVRWASIYGDNLYGAVTPTGFVQGGVVFGGTAGVLSQSVSSLYWNGAGGRLGIGTSSPVNTLDVKGGVAVGDYAGVNSAPSNSLIVSGNIGIGTTNPIYSLEAAGDVYAGGHLRSAGDLYLAGTALSANTTATSGATKVGVYADSMTYVTTNTNVQLALQTLDTQLANVAGGVSGIWTRNAGTGVISPSTATDKFAIGGSTSAAPFYVSDAGVVTFSSDVNLYRLSANKLTTDDTLIISNNLGVGSTDPGTYLLAVGASNQFGVNSAGEVTAASINGNTITTSSGSLTFAGGKVLTVNDNTTFNTSSMLLGNSKSLTLNDSLTVGTNSLTFGGTETVSFTAAKNVTFADEFNTSGAFPITLTATQSSNVTLPATGTLLTNTASSGQTITSSQNSGTAFAVSDSTAITGNIIGQAITLSGTGAYDQTGLKFNLSGAAGTNLNDVVGTGDSWKISKAGVATFDQINVGVVSGATVTSSGIYKAGDGTAAAPSYTFVNSTSTGFYLPAANTIGASVNGAEKVRINSSGYLGIGTTDPQALLSVGATSQFAVDSSGTVTAGVWHGTKISEVYGGTNQTGYAIGDMLYASAIDTLAKLTAGSANQVLTISGGVPTWNTISGSATCTDCVINDPTNSLVNTITAGATTVVPLTLKGTSDASASIFEVKNNAGTSTYLVINAAGAISTGTWQGSTVAQGYGGTGQSSYTAGDVLYANAGGNLTKLPVGSADQVLVVDDITNLPTWATITGGTGGFCTNCVINDPSVSSTNTIVAQNATTSPLTLKAAAAQSANILSWQDSAGATLGVIDENGYLGVATTAPGALLQVGAGTDAPSVGSTAIYATNAGTTSISARDSTNDVEAFISSASTGGTIGTYTNSNLDIVVNNTSAIKILNSGNVGIGSTNPGSNLLAVGPANLFTVSSAGAVVGASFNGNTITTGTGTLTLAAGKTVQFADAFYTSGAHSLTLTTTGDTNVTLPVTGTLLTTTASANQTITSSQASGTVFGLTDTTNVTAAIKGMDITLSGTGVYDQTGLQFNLSGATGTNLNDVLGSGSTWKVSTAGTGYFTKEAIGYTSVGTATLAVNGNVGIGTTSPASMLSVGASSQFQVNSSGAIAAAAGISSAGTINFSGLSASSAVYTDASKNLTSSPPSSGTVGFWQKNGAVISQATITDNLAIGSTAPSSAMFYVPGSTNNNAWFNLGSGNVGIGTTSPTSMLSVGASSQFQVNSSGAIAAAAGISSSGTINFSGLSASSAVYTDASKNLTSSPPSFGTLGFWQKNGTKLAPATISDYVGIGTTAPTDYLDIAGGVKIGAGYAGIATTAPANGLLVQGNVGIGNSAPSVAFSVGASEAFKVTSAGAVTAASINGNTITTGTGTLTLGAGKTLTVDSTTTFATSAGNDYITFAGTERLTLASLKDVTFAEAFSTTSTGPITLTAAGAGGSSVTIPTSGTLLTNTASANQTITSTQNSGSIFGITGATNPAAALTAQAISLTGGSTSYAQTGISVTINGQGTTSGLLKGIALSVSGGTGNMYDVYGTGGTWYATNAGAGYFAGNVGIGTTAPLSKLSVGGQGDASYAIYGNGQYGVAGEGSTYGVYGSDNSVAGDQVGVYGISVEGYGVWGFNDSSDSGAGVYGNGYIGVQASGATFDFYGSSASAKNYFAGNVGIGTTAPTSILHTVASGAKTAGYIGNYLTNVATSSTASVIKTGLSIESTGTWNGSGAINRGLYVNATGGATNYAAIFEGGNVGIGTTAPLSKFEIGVPGVTTDYDVNFYGAYDLTNDNLEDARFFWDASKGAFRVGTTNNSSSWDDANVGIYSVAMGMATTASGNHSTAMGSNTTASGDYSTAMGLYTTAQAYESVVLGRFNIISGTTDSWVATDPLFVIGNGTSVGARADAFTVLKNGNVGIGTTAPGYKLDVNGDVNIAAGSNYKIGGVNQAFDKWTAGTGDDIYRLTGNVGIGTTSPSYPLHLVASGSTMAVFSGGTNSIIRLLSPDGAISRLEFGDASDGDIGRVNYDHSTDAMSFVTNNATQMTILSGGNVGIGTTAPATKLEVNGNIKLGTGNGEPHLIFSRAGYNYIQAPSGGALAFLVNGDAASDANSILVLRETGVSYFNKGNVGIGTTNPTTTLGVVGNLSAIGTSTDSSLTTMAVTNSATVTSDSTKSHKGMFSNAYEKVASGKINSGYLMGLQVYAFRNYELTSDSGTLDDVYGAQIYAGHYNTDASTPITTTLRGLDIVLSLSSGTIGTAYGAYIRGSGSTAAVTNYYGVRIDNLAATVSGSYWGVYQDAYTGGMNYFGNKVGIGVAPVQALDVVGTIRQSACKTAGTLSANTSGDIICTSDENLKDIYGYYQGGLEALSAINPIRFSFKDEDFVHVGFSAQNVKSVLPEASALQDSGYWSLDTTSLVALAINSIKEQQLQINTVTGLVENLASTSADAQTESTNDTEFLFTSEMYQSMQDNLSALNDKLDTKAESTQIAALQSDLDFVKAQIALLTSSTSESSESSSSASTGNEFEEDVVLYQDLSVLGKADFTDVYLSGKLTSGLLQIDGAGERGASIGTISGDLFIMPESGGQVAFMGEKIVMDKKGNLVINEGVIKGNQSFRDAAALAAGETEVDISKEWEDAPVSVVVTPSYETKAWVEQVSEDGFVIHVDTAPTEEESVYWMAIW